MEGRLEEMVTALRDAGHRITPQRLAILTILAGSTAHPDAGHVHREARRHYPSMGLATVYKTIAQLKALSQVMELEFSGLGNRYDGARPFAHPHLLCESCGKVADPGVLDVEAVAAEMARATGFRIRSSRVDFFGLCPACQRKGRGPAAP